MALIGLVLLLTAVLAFSSATSIPQEDGFGIVGGDRINITEAPFQVYLIRDGEFACGGSIISPRHILTAAHCIKSWNEPKDIIVGIGTDDIKEGGTKYSVSKLTRHENFRQESYHDSDIAVITLQRKIQFSKTTKAVKVAKPNFITKNDEDLTATGWGTTLSPSIDERYLRKVVVPKISIEECKIEYGDDLTDSMFCAGVINKDTCHGDSGGPLTQDTKQGKVLVGVTSWGHLCGAPGKPGVYTKVSKFFKWIKNIVVEDN